MADQVLIGVDIGTTGSKGVLVDTGGRVLAYHFCEHAVATPRPGWSQQDADAVWWGDLCRITRALLAQSGVDPRTVAAVGVSATGPNLLPVDESGNALYPALLYSDNRAAAEIDELTARLGPERILELAGRPLPPDSVGAKIFWLRNHEPLVYERMRTAHTSSSYLVFRLTGRSGIDAASAEGNNPFFDAQTETWREDVCLEVGLRPDLFPPIRPTTDVVGGVTAAAAAETGLAPGTPAIVGTCDGLAETLSTGAVLPGEASLLYGTTMGLSLIVPPPAGGPSPLVYPLLVPGLWCAGMSMTASGALTRWFRDQFGQPELDAQAELGLSAYQLLAMQAEGIPPGSEGLVALPYFAGERSPIWDPLARGLILGLTLSHTRAHLYRALLEGTAYGLRHGLEELQIRA